MSANKVGKGSVCQNILIKIWALLLVVIVAAKADTTATFTVTKWGLHLDNWASSGNSTCYVGKYARGNTGGYSEEVLNYINLSSLTEVTIKSAVFRVYISSATGSSLPNNVTLYEQNHQPYNGSGDYNYYNRDVAWSNSLGTANVSSAGVWAEISSDALKNLVQNWTKNSANNKGLILGGNFGFQSYYWTITNVQLVLTWMGNAPKITTHPKSDTVNEGTSVTFTTSATGATPIYYKWQKLHGTKWDSIGPGASSYTIPAVRDTDAAKYRAIAYSSFGIDTSNEAILGVCLLPKITSHPRDTTILVGQTATFTVANTGTPPFTYRWQVWRVATSTWVDTNGTANPYIVSNVPLSLDGKKFRCQVTGCATPVYSNQAVLTVDAAAKIKSVTPASPYYVKKGTAAAFIVTFDGKPSPSIRWEKQNGASWDSVWNSATYSIAAVAQSNNGIYRVKIFNKYATDSSAAITMQVYETPVIGTQPRDTIIIIGQTATFSITTTAGFPLTYQWQVRPRGTGAWTSISGATATGYSTPAVQTADDSAAFRCVVKSPVDSTTSNTARILLTKAPTVTIQPGIDTVNIGQQILFTAAATGVPAPTLSWWHNPGSGWVVIPGKTAPVCTVSTAASFSDSGYYRVVAMNFVDTATSDSAKLLVCKPPSVTKQPRDTIILTGTTATFGITADGFPLTYQWQKKAPGLVWQDISGGNKDTLKFTATSQDDGACFRCVARTLLSSATSDSAKLSIGYVPVVTSKFTKDNPFAEGQKVILTGSVTGTPLPSLNWYFVSPATPTPVSKGTGDTLMLLNAAKTDSGFYYFVATNTFGSANSDTAYVHVLSMVKITTDLTNTYTGVQGCAMNLTVQATGDGTINYQWYRKDTLQIGKTSPVFELSPIDSVKHKRNTFYCEVWNTAFGKVIGTRKSAVCTLLVGIYFNPFSVTARKIDRQHIELGINAQQSIKNMQTELQLADPWCDSLWVVYRTKTFAKSIHEGTVVRYSTKEIKSKWPDTSRYVLAVPELAPGQKDSSYYFSHTVKWHQQGKDTLLTSFVNAATVLMLDTSKVKNLLGVTGIYIPKSDSALLIVRNINYLTDSLHDSITVECSRDKGFSPLIFIRTKDVATLLKMSKKLDTLILDSLGTFPFQKDTIYCRWSVIGKNGLKSEYVQSEFQAGQDRPVFTGVLRADSTNSSTQIRFQWTMPDTGIDNMRIWYDTKKSINIGDLPSDVVTLKPFDVSPYGLVDTLDNLSDSTRYYVWAQIYDDGLWSRISPSCTASVVTAHGDTATIFNTIKIDSAWFDDTTNWIFVKWNIDTTQLPPDRMYQYGYTYGLDDSSFLKERPKQWDSVYQGSNSSVIKLGKDVWFDTVYSVGLWLRGKNLLTGKTTQPAMPTDSSRRKVKTGPFMWQNVTLASVPCPDTEYVANRKIIFRTLKDKPFDFTDTVRVYHRNVLPGGFVPVGGMPFKFTKKSPEINDFVIGMRYAASLPQGVTKNKLRLYRDIGGYLCVLYGSYEENGIVWAQVGKNDLGYPFFVLADTARPRILPQAYSDTVDSGALKVETDFKIQENAGNLRHEFMYGAGDKGYSYTKKDTLKPGRDSITCIVNNANNDMVSVSFGLRARLIVSDGVNADTEDVSRVVRSGTGEAYPVNPLQWTPLRVTMNLDNNGLIDSVFNRSTGETNKLWNYDKTKQRIFRYFRPGMRDTNDWTEYEESIKEYFGFSSGRVIWLKSAEGMQIQFGGGVTQSLKKPYVIELKPKTWTDLSLPYQFYVMLRDILEATGAPKSKELEVYQWVWKDEEKIYNPEPKFIGKLDNDLTKVRDTIISDQPNNAYIVYNHDTGVVKLVIPPICLPLSKYANTDAASYTGQDNGNWVLRLLWQEKEGSGYSKVLMAYNPQLGTASYYGPLPPSMGELRAGVVDTGRNVLCGYGIQSTMSGGGLAYTVEFVNNSGTSKTVSYRMAGGEAIPEGYAIKLLNPDMMRYEESAADQDFSLTIGAQGRALRVVVVGSGDYFDSVLQQLAPWNLQFVKAYPNPFRGYIRLHYTLPGGIKEVRFTLFDLRGRALWRVVENNHTTKGAHVSLYDGRTGSTSGGYLSSGMYIIRMSAVNREGKVICAGEKRITCIR